MLHIPESPRTVGPGLRKRSSKRRAIRVWGRANRVRCRRPRHKGAAMSATPTTPPPAWLEAAAKLDAIAADRVPLAPPPAVRTTTVEVEAPAVEAKPPSRLPAAPVAVPDVPTEARQEVDLGWHGYDPGALLPGTLVLSVLTAGTLLEVRRLVPPSLVVEAVYAPL